jgi:SAM-dependent methyltransferase
MRDNVKTFTVMAAKAFSVPEPVLEIGSRPAEGQEDYAELRPCFADKRYIGGDFLPGPAVDVLLDTHQLGVADGSVGSVVMMDTLEHVQDPLLALREAHRILRDDGLVLIGSVMNFPIHNHPWDYWRFTPAAFDLLLRPFPVRAVWYQGDPLAPHTVLAAAQKSAAPDAQVAFAASAAALEANWPESAYGGPLLRFEPVLDAIVHESASGENALPELRAGVTVEQTFRCPADSLARIDMKFRTGGRMNFCHVKCELRDEATGRLVAERRQLGQHIVDGVWSAFIFSPISSSAGRDYRLVLSSWDGREGAAVAPILSDQPDGDSEQLCVSGEYHPGGICFRALCLEQGYSPPDYRALSGQTDPTAIEDAAARAGDAALLRQIATTQSAQLWQVASQVDDDLQQMAARVDALERRLDSRLDSIADDLKDILSFVGALRSSIVYKAATQTRSLLRRRNPNKGR